MTRKSIWMPCLLSLLATTALQAGPSDLLKQAIDENQKKDSAASSATQSSEADVLAAEAEKLTSQREFKEAVKLYEKAYRLDPNNRAMYARLLVTKRSAGLMTEQDREALALIEEEQAESVNRVFRSVRLNLIQARQALREGDSALALQQIRSGYASLETLPDYVDVAPYQKELRTLENAAKRKAAKALKRIEADGSTASVVRKTSEGPTMADAGEESSSTSTTVVTTESSRMTHDFSFAESGEIIAIDEALYGDQAIHAYERELARALNRQRAEHLIHNQVAAFPPPVDSDMVYPADWAEKTARRAEYRDGVIHEGRPFQGPDGQTYQTVIYDLAELVHPVPNFYASYPGTVREQRMQELDRQYLRERSMIFNGWPEDLAAGMPLLHFFGGIDNNAISTRTDPNETQRIVNILDRFIHSESAGATSSPTDPN